MNNTVEIKELLDKYFEGETSLQEEKDLKEYFNGNEVATELKAFQGLFQFFKVEKEIVLPTEHHLKLVPTQTVQPNQVAQPAKIRHLYLQVAKIAAVLLVAICTYLLLPKAEVEHPQQAINWEQYEVTNEEEAIEKTIAALKLVSSKLNSGAKRAAKEVHHVQAAAKVFKK